MRSFVIGNGKSRLQVDLESLRRFGKIYGCNALYREFIPDYLVAVDYKMLTEIAESGFQQTCEVWTNYGPAVKNKLGFKLFYPSLGWSSGPSALHLASQHAPTEIYILGFDYVGNAGLVNNVYSDTENYKKSTDKATYHGNWEKQTITVIKSNPHIQYYRVVGDYHYKLNNDSLNYSEIRMEEFISLLENWKKH
jgi:hypothetical protein